MRLYLIAPQSNALFEYAGISSSSGKRLTRLAPTAIATVAALAPADFEVVLCDEALEAIDYDTNADVIGISANVSQAERALLIAARFRDLGKTVVLGGPHVSLAPTLFEGQADSIVVGELEPVAERFFEDMRRGALLGRYDGAKADMALSPAPRWDLYPNDRALSGVVQTSRGCPFECHFCDVIQYLGRVQRHKTNDQVITEVQALYDFGHNLITLADDNFTVYRRRAKDLLAALAAWNGGQGRDYVTFTTQMSIDVARDEELLAMCNQAGLLNAFVGLESSSEAALIESRKRQNLRVDLGEQCRRIAAAGIRIEGGLMVGFDSDDLSAFRRQFEFAMSLPVGTFNLSVLVAPLATPLYETMRAAGRIVLDDPLAQFPSANLVSNFEPAQMTRDELFVGAKWLTSKLLDADNFLKRFTALADQLAPPPWVRAGGRRYFPPARRLAAGAVGEIVRGFARAGGRDADLVRRSFAIMKARPDVRDGLGDALTHHLMTLRNAMQNGVYDAAWAQLDAPPFGAESAQHHLTRIRSAAQLAQFPAGAA